jgi:hypothetical protein
MGEIDRNRLSSGYGIGWHSQITRYLSRGNKLISNREIKLKSLEITGNHAKSFEITLIR